MLKGIDPILTPDILYALCSMGHGDEMVVVDAHYPAETSARASTFGKLLRLDGVDAARAVRGLLSIFVLDASEPAAVERMQVDHEPETVPEVVREVQAEVDQAWGAPLTMAQVPRKDFYQRAGKAFCVIITGEARGWGCFIFRKGVEVAPNAPRAEGNASTAQWKS